METVRTILIQFPDEVIGILLAVSAFLLMLLTVFWMYKRRRLHQFSHHIPASVVKSYLDSIISNSHSLKSSLLEGGDLKSHGGVPSVIPTDHLVGGENIMEQQGGSTEEMEQKNAELASLRLELEEKNKMIDELEKTMPSSSEGSEENETLAEENNQLKTELEELKSQLKEPSSHEESDKLNEVVKERDQLKERLEEYGIIEEDLANLKLFQEENKKLKETIEQLKGGQETPTPEETPSPEEIIAEMPALEAPPEETHVEIETEALPEPQELETEAIAEEEPTAEDSIMELAQEEMPEVPANEGKQKSAEELLSEFEKMLG